jgi:hypothetical protein
MVNYITMVIKSDSLAPGTRGENPDPKIKKLKENET